MMSPNRVGLSEANARWTFVDLRNRKAHTIKALQLHHEATEKSPTSELLTVLLPAILAQ
jgi:hypothetical protein